MNEKEAGIQSFNYQFYPIQSTQSNGGTVDIAVASKAGGVRFEAVANLNNVLREYFISPESYNRYTWIKQPVRRQHCIEPLTTGMEPLVEGGKEPYQPTW